MKKSLFFLVLLFFVSYQILAQQTKVLFIGNSYTDVNSLPTLFYNIATSTGDDVFVSSNTPGGSTFQQHCTNQSATMIQQGGWDYVVLQEQSQLPAFPIAQVQANCFPYAAQLNQMVETYNPCAETVFYMTWGRKYGDQQNAQYFPPIGTYEGMDSLLFERYMQMTQDNNAIVSPVGRVWRYLRTNHPSIELYTSDNSHPSLEGSYAAACAMYATILRKDPTLITNYCSVDQNTAQIIQNAVKTIIYDNQAMWYIGERDLKANFYYSSMDGFQNLTENTNSTTQYHWDFGNGASSTNETPNYLYPSEGVYTVTLEASDNCDQLSVKIQEIDVVFNAVVQNRSYGFNVFPNPTNGIFYIDYHSPSERELQIQIVDKLGICKRSIRTNSSTIVIDTNGLSAGLYLIRIKEGNEIKNAKIIVQ
jgi:hypothetical protein